MRRKSVFTPAYIQNMIEKWRGKPLCVETILGIALDAIIEYERRKREAIRNSSKVKFIEES